MPSNPLSPGSVRPAEQVNAEIRALWPHPAVRLTAEQRARYALLVEEWTLAVAAERACGEIVKAA
ncbi:hypothetical protein [Streptomyces acidicola]|uniref:Uncharacterized protein n=1 Tax=Streptomyces acidicola TaxID=2596892 RepID=A0A5N8WJA8_9ACTN|nr:hypothetical protein [Streptomyces acidicola]MPY47192.1 hypothetical protein [Streptomyces acidicola]MPY47331.1 hypothetical protein [Streptomyces acidicola]